MKTRNDITVAIWIGDEPDEIALTSVLHQVSPGARATLLRFAPYADFMVWFRPDSRVAMLTALRDKIDAHLKEIADHG